MPTTTSLLIADSQELIRLGVRAMLAGTSIKIIGEATDTKSTLTLAKKHKPAVVLLDVAIPGGDAFELARTLSKSLPGTALVLMTALDNPTYMARASAVGAAHCLLKDVSQKELVAAIENAAAGKPVSGSGKFGRVTASLAAREKGPALDAGLTPRESQVLAHVAYGLSNEEVARSLGISVETVKEHVQNILRKLAVNDRTQAAVWAVRSGVV
jgi:DNA-binding NarL/FixJ family response regulator